MFLVSYFFMLIFLDYRTLWPDSDFAHLLFEFHIYAELVDLLLELINLLLNLLLVILLRNLFLLFIVTTRRAVSRLLDFNNLF